MAGSAARAARSGEGADAAQRRAGAAASGAALGPDREGLSIRDRRGERLAGGLFQGRSQLLVYHFMFGPDYKAGCPSCSTIADGFNGFAVHLANHDVTLGRCRGRRSPSCRRTSGGWGGRFPGRPRSTATSISTSTSRSPRQQQREGERRIQLPARRPPDGRDADSRSRSPSSRPRAEPMPPRTRATGRA